jgi:hypothetical protein
MTGRFVEAGEVFLQVDEIAALSVFCLFLPEICFLRMQVFDLEHSCTVYLA